VATEPNTNKEPFVSKSLFFAFYLPSMWCRHSKEREPTMYRCVISIFAAVIIALSIGTSAEADESKAYLVGLVTVEHKDWVKEYRVKNAELLKKYGGRILVRGKPAIVLEGAAPDADAILVVEFPSMERASAWYNDPDYQPLIELRQTGAEVDFVLVKGLKQ
jgi:uncharacterized protein (DUF1330 family)